MEIEEKLDEDFLFYLQFVSLQKLPQGDEFDICEAWLHKLCGEACKTIEEKRNRNIYLSNLVLQMEQKIFKDPFTSMPSPEKLGDATEIFGLQGPVIKEPEWMTEVVGSGDAEEMVAQTLDASTYLATKYLPSGRGALGYIAVSLDDQPLQIKKEGFDDHLNAKFDQMVPPLNELERLIINRNNPEERERVIKFYETILRNIGRQIDGRTPLRSNAQIDGFIKQLEENLKKKEQWSQYEQMGDDERYQELLYVLDMHINERIVHIQNRADFLDNIENNTLRQSFFETSLQPEDVFKENKGARAVRMWEQTIEAGPPQKMVNQLAELYPVFVVKKFIELIANAKEQMAIKIQRRHENLVSQLKKEMRKEGEKGKKKYEETKVLHDKIVGILDHIKDYDKRAFESEKQKQEHLYGHRKERDMIYEEIRSAMIEAHQHATVSEITEVFVLGHVFVSSQEEAKFGCYLSQQINTVNEQNQLYDQINEDSILKIEDANMETMKNIKRLAKLIKQHEQRISNVRSMMQRTQSLEQGGQFFFM